MQQWRAAGRWPECLDTVWRKLEVRHGRSGGTREMIALVRLRLTEGWDRLIRAVEEALRLGVTDAAAVIHIQRMPNGEDRRQHALPGRRVGGVRAPLPVMDEYDQLLGDVGVIQ